MEESFQIPYVTGVLILMIIFLIIDRIKVSLVFLFTISLLMIGGIISPDTFISGLSNTSILSIFLLIIITAGINSNFNLTAVFNGIFGKTVKPRFFILKMGAAVAGISAFMNNTPVVAMLMPYMHDWGKKNNISPSKLLIPLSYAAIVGGVITLIGTSTNLVLNGLMQESNIEVLGFFDFLIPGLLLAAVTILFLSLFGPFLLKSGRDMISYFEENTRNYLVETVVKENAEIIGKSIEEAGLRNLQSVFLTEIVRKEHFITPVSPYHRIEEGDILLFAGETDQIFELLKREKGLELSKKEAFEIKDNAELFEAVIAQNSTLDHKTARDIGFRDTYDAAIVGIHRRGEKLSGKIGTITLHTGDLLLLTAGKNFGKKKSHHDDLIIINTVPPISNLKNWKKIFFILASLGSIILAISGIFNLFETLLTILLIQLLTGMNNVEQIKKNISFDLLIILVAALALGEALIQSGAGDAFTSVVFNDVINWHPLMVLGGIFLATFLLTSFVTNVAAISIIFPVVFSIAANSDIPDEALFLTAAFSASCCFATPFAYQTNLMVMEAGSYRFMDFVKVGLPLSILYAAVFLGWAAINYNLI